MIRTIPATLAGLFLALTAIAQDPSTDTKPDKVTRIDPPEKGFFSKRLEYRGIPIKAHEVVSDEALFQAWKRLDTLLGKIPVAAENMRLAGAELHIIGKDQVTSDLPEHQHLKGKPFDGSLTVDQRTRGLGGLLTSCGEENLLKLDNDRYRGRDICLHEFSHNLHHHGLGKEIFAMIDKQYKASLAKGLWKPAYASTNNTEFFAELTMWYFGTFGDTKGLDPKPAPGKEGLRAYDPEAYELLDKIYPGKLTIPRLSKQNSAGKPQ